MNITYSEERSVETLLDSLATYRSDVSTCIENSDFSKPESALATWKDSDLKTSVAEIKDTLGEVEHVVLIGIGGSSLGVEAIHAALKSNTTLHVLDSVAPYRIREIVETLKQIPQDDIAICAISKSGGTTETLTNTEVLLTELREIYGEKPYDRTVCIGNPGNPLLDAGKLVGAHVVTMHEAIGGRYSVFTAVGLVPLVLLGHDIDEILRGVEATTEEANEASTAQGAATLFSYLGEGVRNVNFFAFDTRLEELARWYRQLAAESLGKEHTTEGNKNSIGFIPTISTPVELHSIGQLYFSGFPGVFTDFVTFDETSLNYSVSKDTKIAEQLAGKSMREIHDAIQGGVVGAYKERSLPYRITTFERDLPFALGLFMGMRMLETMYLATLMNVNAFDQPNVELYKDITRDILNK